MRTFAREAAARLFLSRQHLSTPRELRLTPRSLARFAADAGGIQIDSINVVERAHYLAIWSRFGPYDKAAVDGWIYRKRVLEEYWAHAACLIPAADLPAWARAMADYRRSHTGWARFLDAHPRAARDVLEAIRRRGPLSTADFERPAGRASGWWDWKPAQHALHVLWMSGRLAVHSRRHFSKLYDLAERLRPPVEAMPREEFAGWHLRKTLRALGAAAEADLPRYLTFPRTAVAQRRRALKAMLATGEAVEIGVEGVAGRWYALAEDLAALESAPASRGTTLLSPFDSLLWHRGRARALFGFDYRIEVYTPAAKRVHGYYTLPILHDGRLVGRLDAKNHREDRRLEVRGVHFETPPDDGAIAGVRSALESLARFLGAGTTEGLDRLVKSRRISV
ncbi:MAG: winged helix-turn-helix domain-containing protein [Deltaproteobacteria bacterium]|nr:MAG: winged helix-turn-helix domain-containing protein [Deltaproteobacteria bacterium]